ncbi:hypothetical protein N7475_005360 [Penicillium sp. IBT 31633x]|nr:hypothetical protein N7475_005360 [Penicillium sp. IBT 31633x]
MEPWYKRNAFKQGKQQRRGKDLYCLQQKNNMICRDNREHEMKDCFLRGRFYMDIERPLPLYGLFEDGPWKKALIKFGVNPRVGHELRHY